MKNNIDSNAFSNRQADLRLGYLAKPKKNSDDVSSGRNAIAIAYSPIWRPRHRRYGSPYGEDLYPDEASSWWKEGEGMRFFLILRIDL